MTLSCPRCHSPFVVTRRRGKASIVVFGAIVGTIQGASNAISDVKKGGVFAKDSGCSISVIAAAVLGSLLGGAAGCAAATAIDATVEKTLPYNFLCEGCGYHFDASRVGQSLT